MNKLIRYLLLITAALLTTTVMAATWEYKGFGGWRTYDQYGNPYQDASGDEGGATANVGLDHCKQLCEQQGDKCRGVEYVDQGGGNTSCETHHDRFAYCDTRGGTRTTVGKDGCWLKVAPTCPSSKWKVISLTLNNKPQLMLKHFPSQGDYVVMDYSGSGAFEVFTEPDCRIRLRYQPNGKYIRTGEPGKSTTQLNGNTASAADASYYHLVEDANNGVYTLQDSVSKNWVGATAASPDFIYAADPVFDSAKHAFFITVLQYQP